jgi:transposase InsO family protein
MPWKESSVMDERMRFVIRLKDGESMATLCREFGISRKTGYKIFERYEQCGLEGLSDRTRRPFRYANQLPEQVEAAIVAGKREKPHWGARKIRERLLRRLPHAIKIPAASTIHAVLDRHGLVARARRSRAQAEGTPLSDGLGPNDLWSTDYKGEFQLGDKRYCYPLTVTDHVSRYLLLCEALESNREELAFRAFERLFRERGLPQAIRSDNGVPFASPNGLFNLSRLSVWWLRLGISIERIRPGHPQQNGRHERMHLTLKKEATRPAGQNILQQQAKFDGFVDEFNTERPHEALHMRCPAEVYVPSPRPYQGIPEPHLSLPRSHRDGHQLRPNVPLSQENQSQQISRRPGCRRQGSRQRHLAGQLYGLRSRLYRSGGKNLAAPRKSLRAKSVTYVLGTFCYLCLRSGHLAYGAGGGT